jgi:hypothetical protein
VRSGLLNRIVGQQFTGVEGSAAAGVLSAVVYVPVGIITLLIHPPTPTALAFGATAGVLASVVSFVADVWALRRVPAHFFGIFMSLNPVFAAAIGAVALREDLVLLDWIAVCVIATANVCRAHGSNADCSHCANQRLGAHRSWATTTAPCCSPAPNRSAELPFADRPVGCWLRWVIGAAWGASRGHVRPPGQCAGQLRCTAALLPDTAIDAVAQRHPPRVRRRSHGHR